MQPRQGFANLGQNLAKQVLTRPRVGWGLAGGLGVKADAPDQVVGAGLYQLLAADAINRTRAAGGRVIPVGTTALRLIESAATPQGEVLPFSGVTEIFIYPGYRFRVTDALMTNFHLPKSTLLMLVSALMGQDRIKALYRHAVESGYRFFSYGDASLLIPKDS